MHIPAGSLWDFDRELLLAINGSWGGGWDVFWWTVSQIWCWIPLYIVMIWLLWQKFGWRKMLVAVGVIVVALALADQTANFFKNHASKLRPTHTDLAWGEYTYNELVHYVKGYKGGLFGTVSGHAATSMAIGFTASGIYRRWWFTLMAGAYIALTCFSRMYLGVHFPLDIIFGLTAGTLISFLMLWIWRVINRRWHGKTKGI